MITVPGRRVIERLRSLTICATGKSMSEVLESCITFPLRMERIRSLFGSGISSFVTRKGPSGQNVSKLFPRAHCCFCFRICQSLALTSLPQV